MKIKIELEPEQISLLLGFLSKIRDSYHVDGSEAKKMLDSIMDEFNRSLLLVDKRVKRLMGLK